MARPMGPCQSWIGKAESSSRSVCGSKVAVVPDTVPQVAEVIPSASQRMWPGRSGTEREKLTAPLQGVLCDLYGTLLRYDDVQAA